MAASIKGPWDAEGIRNFLESCDFPVRLACVGADGYPRVVSLWYRYVGQQLLCVTHRASKLALMLEKQPKVGFEVAPNRPPYHGVRGQGIARLEPLQDPATLKDLMDRYLGGHDSSLGKWLLSRSDDEVLVTITPERLYCWDYRERMADAVGE